MIKPHIDGALFYKMGYFALGLSQYSRRPKKHRFGRSGLMLHSPQLSLGDEVQSIKYPRQWII